MSNKTDIDALKKEQEQDEQLEKSFSVNPVKTAIQQLFKGPFSGAKYRKYSVVDAKALVEKELTEATKNKHGPFSSGLANLLSKVKKASSVEEILTILNEYLFA